MKSIKYDKLIRDKIPEIIEKGSKKAVIDVLDDQTFKKYLDDKLTEELKEYLASDNVEELADLVEVIYAILMYKKVSLAEFESIRMKKVQERGAFDKRLRLKEVIENKKKSYSFVGIDGCSAGWVAVEISDIGFDVDIYKSIEEVCSKYQNADLMLVDMPIGLPESIDDIRPDSEVRKHLSGRTSCIFNTPCRQAVYMDNYWESSVMNKSVLGKGLSKQSFAISPKIREIDEFLKRKPDFTDKLKESHPELCFAILASNSPFILPLCNSKHTPEGHEDRVDTLQDYYSRTKEVIKYVRNNPELSKLMEDCVDALCLAVTAWLGSKHGYKTVPGNPPKDNRGLPMQMVYPGVQEVYTY